VTALRLTALLLRRDARRSAASLGLTGAGIAVATSVALLVVAVGPGLDVRADRLGPPGALSRPDLDLYRDLCSVAAVLLAVPAVLLVGSAARLTAARRDQRLAALRLAGASPGSVVAMTAAETALAATAGAVVGVAGYAAALPAAARIELGGAAWEPGDLWLGAGGLATAVVVVAVLAAASSSVALRKVVISPLGVRHRVGRRRPRLVRFAGFGTSWLAFAVAARAMREGGGLAPVLVGFGAVIGGVSLVGPWFAWALGAGLARLARRPATLLAGRRIADDPRGAYRTVSGIVLGGLVAGFLFGVMPTIDSAVGSDASERLLLEDLRRASVVVAAIALLLATTAATIGAAASILDQRQALRCLRLAGTPTSVLQRARSWQTAVPLVAATSAAVGCGVAVGLSLLVAFGAPPARVVGPELLPLGLLVLAALGGGLGSAALTRPVLLAVTSSPLDDR
jgi:hypothetical protein